MLAFPSMLIDAAVKAGIDVPKNIKDYDPKDYPHWEVFCNTQLGRRCPYAGVHWNNAKVIAEIPNDKIFNITMAELFEKGFE